MDFQTRAEARLAELRQMREKYAAEAQRKMAEIQRQLGALDGAISELERLLDQTEVEGDGSTRDTDGDQDG